MEQLGNCRPNFQPDFCPYPASLEFLQVLKPDGAGEMLVRRHKDLSLIPGPQGKSQGMVTNTYHSNVVEVETGGALWLPG